MESINDIDYFLSSMQSVFDVVRLVDPVNKIVMIKGKDNVVKTETKCYSFWNNNAVCKNCIAMRTYNENETISKIEYNKDKIFFVMAVQVILDNTKYVIETIKDITNTGIIEDIKNKSSEEVNNLVAKMNDLLIKDELTQIYNRRYINERLPYDINACIAHHKKLSVVMADIDLFKLVNDNYGHVAGDYIIKQIAAILGHSIRKETDWVGRYGGEEFLIVANDIDGDMVYEKIEAIRKKIEETEFIYNGIKIKVTVSFGISCLDITSTDCNCVSLIEKADANLYKAKRVVGIK